MNWRVLLYIRAWRKPNWGENDFSGAGLLAPPGTLPGT